LFYFRLAHQFGSEPVLGTIRSGFVPKIRPSIQAFDPATAGRLLGTTTDVVGASRRTTVRMPESTGDIFHATAHADGARGTGAA
jgi:hypothetical protein